MPILIFVIIFLSGLQAAAKDFGKVGTTFEIKEESFLEMIQKRLSRVDIDQEQQKMREIARQRVEEPESVGGISQAQENRIFYYDLTFEVKEDIKLPCGKILHKAGTKVNPLDHMSFDRRLIFVDGRSQEQIEWLEKTLAFRKEAENQEVEDRVILISGRPLELKDRLGREVYFDQHGELMTKFGIRVVPAMVEQEKPEDRMLKVSEVKVND
jgi:conjugal transfer pilus assembly protein TraW